VGSGLNFNPKPKPYSVLLGRCKEIRYLNPTIFVVIDRLKLEKQFRDKFGNLGLPYVTYARRRRFKQAKMEKDNLK
jgi:hypothetical protein